jgi:hypothetical protein
MQKSDLGIFQQYSETIDLGGGCSAEYISFPNFQKAIKEILEREGERYMGTYRKGTDKDLEEKPPNKKASGVTVTKENEHAIG